MPFHFPGLCPALTLSWKESIVDDACPDSSSALRKIHHKTSPWKKKYTEPPSPYVPYRVNFRVTVPKPDGGRIK